MRKNVHACVVDALEARRLFSTADISPLEGLVYPEGEPMSGATAAGAIEPVAGPQGVTASEPFATVTPRAVGAKILESTGNAGRPAVIDPSPMMRRAFTPQVNASDYDLIAGIAADGTVLTLDLEGTGYPTGHEDPAQLTAMVDERMDHFDAIRQRVSPGAPLGIYSFLPTANYYAALRHEAFLDPDAPAWLRDPTNPETQAWLQRYASWTQGNDNVHAAILAHAAATPGGELPDFLCPQIYVFNNSRQDFEWLLNGMVNEARRVSDGRPVYAFMSPYYWEADNNPLGNQPADYDFFRYELETALSVADGVVLWGGYSYAWDENADWVRALRDVLHPPTTSITAPDATAAETGGNTGTYTVSRTGNLDAPLTVSYTVGGTATGGADYQALPGSVTIPAGQASVNFALTPLDDPYYEPAETVVVTLQDGSSYDLSATTAATVTISSNDPVPVAPSTLAGTAFTGGRVDLTWRDNSPSETGFVVEWSSNGTTWSQLASVGPNVKSYSATGLVKNVYYWFRVKAVAGAYSSPFSNALKIRAK